MTNTDSSNALVDNPNLILDEINYRLSLNNKFNIIVKNLPRYFTKSNLKDLIPELSSCRIPEKTKSGKVNYAFVQFPNENLVDKYIDFLNRKLFNGKKLLAKKIESKKQYTNIDDFHLKKLFACGLKDNVKYREIKALYPNARIGLGVTRCQKPEGTVVLKFETDKEAYDAFMDNKLVLHGAKYQLIYPLKKKSEKTSEPKVEEVLKFNFDEPEKLLEEIKNRFNEQSSRSVIVKNLPASLTLAKLKQLAPNIRNCRLNLDKKIAFIDFNNTENANESVKKINGTSVGGKQIRAFVCKQTANITSLSIFDLSKLHLTNLPFDTTESDLKTIFPNCEIDFPLNTDETCIGYATLIFENSGDALKVFSQNNYRIKDLPICVNFHRESKPTEKPVAEEKTQKLKNKIPVLSSQKSAKRKFNEIDEQVNEVSAKKSRNVKEMKIVPQEKKVASNNDKKKVIKIDHSTQKKNETVKKTEVKQEINKNKKPVLSVPMEKKIVKSDQATTQKKNEVVKKTDVKQELNKNKIPVLSQKPTKRKFEEIDEKVNEVTAKKSRVTIKAKVNNKINEKKEK